MPNVESKSDVGRQTHLPLKRAFDISLKSLKIRFWRSIITAGGIFLGIAFLSTILAQWIMQWPQPEKPDAGYVRISGQVVAPGDYEVWKPIPVEEGLKAGIPEAVIEKVAGGKTEFSLAAVVQGEIEARRADKNLARVLKEWEGLKKLQDIKLYVAAAADEKIKVDDAVKAGVPRKDAKALADKDNMIQGSDLVELIKTEPKWVKPLYASTARDLEITVGEAVEQGVPPAIAKMLAGEGRSFKGAALNDAIKDAHPKWMKIWRSRVKRNAIFKTVPSQAVQKLSGRHAISLADLLQDAKTKRGEESQKAEGAPPGAQAIDPDWQNVKVVNANGRKDSANLEVSPQSAAALSLGDGDNVYVPDLTSRYRMMWLVVMSLLVCTVGITNSMLMSVTERFKEIGTMKCLGAMDRFVVTLFMLESGMLGIVASVVGWAFGFVLMVLLGGLTRGWDLVGTIGFIDVVRTFGISVGVGLLLTIVATIAPAKRAADMPPAMALRSEI